jgi:hypothetical protein
LATQREAGSSSGPSTGPSRWARQAAQLLGNVRDDALRDELRLRFEERAGICEFDGKLSRVEAEKVAYDSLVAATRSLAGAGS